jgi:hypothetical protein
MGRQETAGLFYGAQLTALTHAAQPALFSTDEATLFAGEERAS